MSVIGLYPLKRSELALDGPWVLRESGELWQILIDDEW